MKVDHIADEITYEFTGPDSLLPHGGHYHHSSSIPASLRRRAAEVPFALTKRQVSAHGILNNEINEILYDMIRQNGFSNRYNAGYLTHRELDFDAISQFERGKSRNRVKAMSPALFSHAIPFIADVELKKLLQLRRNESGAFELYRDILSKNVRKHYNATPTEQAQLFNDVVRPELAKIDAAVRRSRKLLVKSITHDLIVASGAIGIGLFSGLLPLAIGAAAIGLGSLHYSPQFVRKLTELCSEPKEASQSRFYFLWKVRKSANRHI